MALFHASLGQRPRETVRAKSPGAESAIQFEAVPQYVDTQEERHRTRTFQEEYRELLRRHGVEFDERYVWD